MTMVWMAPCWSVERWEGRTMSCRTKGHIEEGGGVSVETEAVDDERSWRLSVNKLVQWQAITFLPNVFVTYVSLLVEIAI